MSFLGLDPGDPNNWYQSPHLSPFPATPAAYGGGISNGYYSSPYGSSTCEFTQFSSQPNPYPPLQLNPSVTIINGHLLPHQFPCVPQTHSQFFPPPYLQPIHPIAPQPLTTTPRSPSIPTYHSPHSNPNPWIYPPISQSHFNELSVTSVHSQFVPTKTMIAQPIYHSAPPPSTHEQPRPTSDLKQVELVLQLRPISMEPERVHKNQMDARISKMQDSFEAIRAQQSSFRAEILEELRQLHLGPKALVTESASSPLQFGSLPAGSVTLTAANGSSSMSSASARGIRSSENPSSNFSHHEVILGLTKDFTTTLVTGNLSEPTTTAVVTEKLVLNVDQTIAGGVNGVKFSDSHGRDVANSILWRNAAQTHYFQHTSFGDGSSAGYGELGSHNLHNHNSVGSMRVDFQEREEKELEDEDGEDDNEDKDDEGENDGVIFGSSAASKHFLEELERESNFGSYSGAESYGDRSLSYSDISQRVAGQIVTDSDKEVVTDEGGRLCINLVVTVCRHFCFCKPSLVPGDFALIHDEDHILEDHEKSAIVTHFPQLCQKAGVKVHTVTGDLLMLPLPLHLKLINGDNFNVTVWEHFKCKSCDGDLVGVVEDSQFYYFKKDQRSFAKEQVWAIYDDDGRQRNYGLVDAVFNPGISISFVTLKLMAFNSCTSGNMSMDNERVQAFDDGTIGHGHQVENWLSLSLRPTSSLISPLEHSILMEAGGTSTNYDQEEVPLGFLPLERISLHENDPTGFSVVMEVGDTSSGYIQMCVPQPIIKDAQYVEISASDLIKWDKAKMGYYVGIDMAKGLFLGNSVYLIQFDEEWIVLLHVFKSLEEEYGMELIFVKNSYEFMHEYIVEKFKLYWLLQYLLLPAAKHSLSVILATKLVTLKYKKDAQDAICHVAILYVAFVLFLHMQLVGMCLPPQTREFPRHYLTKQEIAKFWIWLPTTLLRLQTKDNMVQNFEGAISTWGCSAHKNETKIMLPVPQVECKVDVLKILHFLFTPVVNIANLEASGAIKAYHVELKVKWFVDSHLGALQKVDSSVHKLTTELHSSYWLDQYDDKCDSFHNVNEECIGSKSWHRALQISDYAVTLDDKSRLFAKVSSQKNSNTIHLVWIPGLEFSFCDYVWSMEGNICKHATKVNMICEGHQRWPYALITTAVSEISEISRLVISAISKKTCNPHVSIGHLSFGGLVNEEHFEDIKADVISSDFSLLNVDYLADQFVALVDFLGLKKGLSLGGDLHDGAGTIWTIIQA